MVLTEEMFAPGVLTPCIGAGGDPVPRWERLADELDTEFPWTFKVGAFRGATSPGPAP